MSTLGIARCVMFGGPSLWLAAKAARWLHRKLSQGPQHVRVHRDNCRCFPCREFGCHAEVAVAIVAELPRGLPRDGNRLSREEWQALRGIEAASGGRQARQL